MNTNRKTHLPFDLRAVTSDDDRFLYELYCTTREDELNAAGFPPEQRKAFLRMQFNAQKTHYEKYYPAAKHEIITVEDKPVGRQYVDRGEDEILLVDLALLPEYCNRGIGTVLLEKLCAEGRQTAKPLRLYAIKFNQDALRFYKRLGFVEIDDTGVYLLLEWRLQSDE